MNANQTTPTVADVLGETVSLVCCMAVYGPPVVFLAAPWLILGLILSGPFALILTLVLTFLAATALIAGIAAIAAMPYLIFRRLRVPRASVTGTHVPVGLRGVTA